MTGCAKCRHSAHGCAKCNPKRFTFSSRCSRRRPGYNQNTSECSKAFRAWLVSTHNLADGTAGDYAWAFKNLLINKGSVAKASAKLQQVTNICRSKIDAFVRTPQFKHVGEAKKGNAERSAVSCSTSGKSKLICTVGKASKIQGLRTSFVAEKNGKHFAKRLRVLARPLSLRCSAEMAISSDNAADDAKVICAKSSSSHGSDAQDLVVAQVSLHSDSSADADAEVAEISFNRDSASGATGLDLFSQCFPCNASACDVPLNLDFAAGFDRHPNHGESLATEAAEVDLELDLVVDSVKSAGHLSQQCSTMLASMLPFSLSVPMNERSDGQHKVVSMAEETLQTVQSELVISAAAAEAKCESLETTIAELENTVKSADAEFAAWSARWRASLDDASAVANNSARMLDERREAQAQGDTRLASLRKDITALEKAFRAHFQKPMKSGKGPQFQELEPFLQNLEIEQSILHALPSICKKVQNDRSDEEHGILENLEMAIAVKISTLTETVAAETLAASERASAVKNAELDYSSTTQGLDLASSDFQASMKEQGGGQEFLKKGFKAKEAMNDLRSQLEAATGLQKFAKTKLADLTSLGGPLAILMAMKTKNSLDCALHEVDSDMVAV